MAQATYAATREALARGEATCESVVTTFLDAFERHRHLNAFVYVDEERALDQARGIDARRKSGEHLPLAGLVLGIKDVLCIKDWPVSCASRMLEDFNSLYDATAIARLRDQGAIFIGKTNCDEFAMGSTNETSYFGPVLNPCHEAHAPGGSSGGSAAAVAAGLCHAALGSDTGGSIRQPAALCGVVGLKPTYGRVSRYGLVAYASSFDCVGPITRSVEDAALILEAMAGHDPHDATSAPAPVGSFEKERLSVDQIRLGVPEEYFGDGLDEDIRAKIEDALDQLRAQGASVTTIGMPHTQYGVATYYILAMAEASSNLSRYDGMRYGYRAPGTNADLAQVYAESRSRGFGREVRRRIMLGTYVLSSGYYEAYYGKAQRVRTRIRQDFDKAFESVDALVTPVTPMPGIPLGSLSSEEPLQMYLSDVYTVTANLAGVPGLVVPVGAHENGLPIAMQLLGRPFDEARLLRLGQAVAQTMASAA